jgi:hypothetical protein
VAVGLCPLALMEPVNVSTRKEEYELDFLNVNVLKEYQLV